MSPTSQKHPKVAQRQQYCWVKLVLADVFHQYVLLYGNIPGAPPPIFERSDCVSSVAPHHVAICPSLWAEHVFLRTSKNSFCIARYLRYHHESTVASYVSPHLPLVTSLIHIFSLQPWSAHLAWETQRLESFSSGTLPSHWINKQRRKRPCLHVFYPYLLMFSHGLCLCYPLIYVTM